MAIHPIDWANRSIQRAAGKKRAFLFLPWAMIALALPLAAREGCQVPPEFRNPQTTLSMTADSQSRVNGVYFLRGNAVMTYRGMRFSADVVSYNPATHEADARGHVTFDDARGQLEAASAHYNLVTESGWFSKVHGYLRYASPQPGEPATSLFVDAAKITRIDQDTYTLTAARLRSCAQENRGLAFVLADAKIDLGHTVTGHSAEFRFLGLPVFYLPYLVVSAARQPRQTGVLLPTIFDTNQKGLVLGDGFFWAINPSADLLGGVQYFSKRGVGFSGRFRARPSATSEITADFFAINDTASNPNIRVPGGNFTVTGDADDMGDGFRGVVNVNYVNSLAFRSAWSTNFNTAVFSEAQQTGFLTKNFGADSINLYASRYQDFLSSTPVNEQSIIIKQAPSVSFSGVDKQIHRSPFFYGFDVSLDGVGRSEPSFSTPALTGRLDLFPHLTLRSRPFWGFHLTPTAGLRETYYTTSLLPGEGPVNRFLGEFSADLRPPTLEKTFSWRGRRFKHVIEPDVQYRLVKPSDPQNIFDIVRFDTTDIMTDDNELQFSLTNALLERKHSKDDSEQGSHARDLLSWTLTQKYFFDPTFGGVVARGSQIALDPTLSLTGFAFPEGRRLSPLDSDLKFSPANGFDSELRADIDPQGGGLLNAGITSRFQSHTWDVAFTDFFVNRTLLVPAPIAASVPLSSLPKFDLLDFITSHGDADRKGLTEAFRVDYNLSQGIVEDFIGQASYNFGCFALNVQYERFNLGSIRNENMFGFSITLGNIGTFGSLKPGQFLERQLRQMP